MMVLAAVHVLQDRFPGSMCVLGLLATTLSRWLEGPQAVVTLCLGLGALIVASPKIYKQLRIWYRFGRRHIWPSRRRPE